MYSRICKTSTATPAEPGGLLRGARNLPCLMLVNACSIDRYILQKCNSVFWA